MVSVFLFAFISWLEEEAFLWKGSFVVGLLKLFLSFIGYPTPKKSVGFGSRRVSNSFLYSLDESNLTTETTETWQPPETGDRIHTILGGLFQIQKGITEDYLLMP